MTDNSYLSAALYFFGVICVLGLGYLYVSLLKGKRAVSPRSDASEKKTVAPAAITALPKELQ